MSVNGPASGESEDRAAAYLLQRCAVVQKVPAKVRKQIDAALSREAGGRVSIKGLWEELRLRERYGVSLSALRRYARQLAAVRSQSASGQVVRTLSWLMGMPIRQRRRLQEAGQLLLLGRLAEALQRSDLEPEQLVKLADALSKQRTAAVRAEAQRLAERKFKQMVREALRSRKDRPDWQAGLAETIQRIYGIRIGQRGRDEEEAATQTAAAESRGEDTS